jgi:predicted lipid-binding transport protein (Tim44 family)
MDGRIDVLTLVFLIVAVFVIFKLRSVLGRRTGDEEARYERQVRAQQEARDRAAAAKDKVVTLPRRDREAPAPEREAQTAVADVESRMKTFAGGNTVLEKALTAIAKADSSFDPEQFVHGAKQAYEMIVTAFAEGNRKMLKDLLSKDVFDGFVGAINDRESRGEQIDQSFVGINKADLLEAELKGSVANVTMKFVSQLISATRDSSGEVVSGDPQRIREVTDIWTFARDTTSRNPNWRLIATQAPN